MTNVHHAPSRDACDAVIVGGAVIGSSIAWTLSANHDFDGSVCGSHKLIDEGYFDSGTMSDWWRRKARQNGVEYVTAEVADLIIQPGRLGVGHLRRVKTHPD